MLELKIEPKNCKRIFLVKLYMTNDYSSSGPLTPIVRSYYNHPSLNPFGISMELAHMTLYLKLKVIKYACKMDTFGKKGQEK